MHRLSAAGALASVPAEWKDKEGGDDMADDDHDPSHDPSDNHDDPSPPPKRQTVAWLLFACKMLAALAAATSATVAVIQLVGS